VPSASLDDRSREAESPAEALAATLADAMASAWERGERTRAEDLLARHPEVADCPEAAVRLIYEEVLLRRELGDEPSPAELRERFPRWHDELAMLLACDRLVNNLSGGSHGVGPDSTASWPAHGPGARPDVGSRLGGFRLLARLGSGSLGHTFLASDPDLGDRPVVLKLTPRGLDEHVSLARLQHTHIVPLYAAPEFPAQGLRALCMPFLGGASLDRVLDEIRAHPGDRPDGRAIVAAIDRAQEGLPVAVDSGGPACRVLARLAYPEAIAWIAVCLADALHAAHGRGLVHMDVKPANVLIASDGTPMLLDFHLARPPIEPGDAPPSSIGGTPAGRRARWPPSSATRWRPWRRAGRSRRPSTAGRISSRWAA
jgi:serine/threonine protein kinase